jgi:serine/threonine protein kinase
MTRCQLSIAVDGVNHCDLRLSELLGEGANAKVYREKIGSRLYAVKVYTDQAAFNLEKLNFMIFNPPADLYFEDAGKRYPLYAWPVSLVKNLEEGYFGTDIGYVMPLIDKTESKTLEYFYDYNLSKQLKTSINKALSLKIEILKNLSDAIATLHTLGHKFVDLKPQNVGVYEGTNIVSLLDCDGYEINYPSSGKKFSSTMVSPDYIAPEISGAKLEDIIVEKDQDNYALAVIIFQMLNNGIHPFQGIIADPNIHITTNDEAAVLGLYAYGGQQSTKIMPKPQSVHSTFLPTTRHLFDRAFLGKTNRPSAQEWSNHFSDILENKLLVRCVDFPSDAAHIRFKELPCPACTLNYINSSRSKKAGPEIHASISSFDDIAKDYNHPPIKVAGDSGNFVSYFIVIVVCLALLGTVLINSSKAPESRMTNSGSTTESTPSLSISHQDEVCKKALNSERTSWDNNAFFANYVQEAQRRGLSIDQCRRLLGFPAQGTQRQQRLADVELCHLALSRDKIQWETSTTYSEHVQEARNRGFTVERCRSFLGILVPLTPQMTNATSRIMGWSVKFDSNLIYLDPDVHDKVGDSGYSYQTHFYLKDSRTPKTDFVMFVFGRGNIAKTKSCAHVSPQKYFESVLSNSRDKINSISPGEDQDRRWVNVSSFGYRTGNEVKPLYIRDYISMSKTDKDFVVHVGGRFAKATDVLKFDDLINNMRFPISVDRFNFGC